MHNITSFLDKRMYSNAASECFWTGACKVCASPAVMAHKQPRCPLPLKVLHESVDDSMTLCFGGWHFEFWDDHTSIHLGSLGTCFGRFENEVNKKTLQKNTVKEVSNYQKQLKIRLERSKVIWYGEALTRSRTDGWEVGGLKVVQTSHASDGSSSSSGIPSTCASTTECWDTEINNPRIYCGSMVKDGQRIMWAYVCLCDIVRSRSGIKRADIARLVALSVYGGVRTPGHNLPVWEDLIAFDCKLCTYLTIYLHSILHAVIMFLPFQIFHDLSRDAWFSFSIEHCHFIFDAKRGLCRHRWVKLSVDETTGRRKFDTSSVEHRATQVEATSSLEPLLRAAEASDAAVLLGEAQRIARNRNHWFLMDDWFTWIMDDFNFPFCKDTFHMQCMIHMISTYSI